MIKFKAWHKEEKIIKEVLAISFTFKHCAVLHKGQAYNAWYFDEIELMQSTGLYSKDKIEIFEGDILCYDHGGGVETFIIERNPDDNQLHARYLYMSGYNTDYLAEAPCEGSIIVGNRFGNPELLEERE